MGTDGRPPSTIWLLEGFFYKFVLATSSNVTIQTYDNLYGIINAAAPAATPIPVGGILLWSGSIGSIPAGYALCNGTNGTPDLRDRFVVGAGTTYAVNASGGSADAIVVTHTHTTTVTDPGHFHTTGITDNEVLGSSVATGPSVSSRSPNLNAATTQNSFITDSETTGISVTNANAGVSGTNGNLPPYYALCYIMKT